MVNCKKTNINDLVQIIFDCNKDNFYVVRIQDLSCVFVVWNGKDLETAKAIRTAYINGYVDCQRKCKL